uniref:NADH dehydrogenase [ubiquinone] 1 alpha subcomplex subunit 12 n=1 Tax=Lotharella globosa TaxID=91324 RepID=A0A6V3TEK4_9EUKA
MFKGLRSIAGRMQKALTGKELVGMDKHGNRYVLFQPDKGRPPRRMVDPYNGVYDQDKIHKLWSMWLAQSREDAPTEEDMEAYDRQQEILAARVKKVQEEDEKVRLQEMMERQIDTESSGSVSIEGVMEAMNKDKKPDEKPGSGGGKFQPQGWNPNKE